MIYVTGDTHGQIDFYKLHIFASEHPELTKDDYLIIAGDFGGVWDSRTLDEDLAPYEELPFTVLFVDGNHENFDLLATFPIEEWKGGLVQKLRTNIIHLMRGQVYEIEGKTFFTLGGATSIDKFMRQEHLSWWRQEQITDEDMKEARKNLEKHNFKVDYIVTHSCDEKALYLPQMARRPWKKQVYLENAYLSVIENIADYGHWYFGHYHMDARLTNRKTALYQEIIPLDTPVSREDEVVQP